MTLEISDLLQATLLILVSIIGFYIRQLGQKLDSVANAQFLNSNRLVRIETKLGLPDFINHDA
jgi:hypothetical protein